MEPARRCRPAARAHLVDRDESTGMPSNDEISTALVAELSELRQQVPGVLGSVLAGVDGLLILAESGGGVEPYDLAALAAASHGIGRQVGRTLRQGQFCESTVHNQRGYCAVYLVDERTLLAVIGDDGLNVARLHLAAKQTTARLAELLLSRATTGIT